MFASFLDTINNFIGKTSILVIILFGGGLLLTVLLGAYNLNFKQIGKALKNSGDKTRDGISGFQALMVATSSRIGNGNIAGVASAIMIGGPGALFWMWITSLIGMATAFCEGALAQLYKHKVGNAYQGGTQWYISRGLNKPKLGALYAFIAALTFGGAYMGVQSHTIAANFYSVAGNFLPFSETVVKITMGAILVVILLSIVLGGIKSIGNFAAAVMPIMGTLYLLVALYIVFTNIGKTGEVWSLIFNGAFGTKQVLGGISGYTLTKALQKGAARGVFSNEAGIGSATPSAAASNSTHPIQQGLLQSLSTFIDTVIICTASGFIILYSDVWKTLDPSKSATLIQSSIASQFGGGFAEWIVFIAVFLFGLTTIIGLTFYSETAIAYFTKDKKARYATYLWISAFLIYSSVAKTEFIWNLEGPLTLTLVVINVLSILPQVNSIKLLVADYKAQMHKQPKVQPKFKAGKEFPNATFWK